MKYNEKRNNASARHPEIAPSTINFAYGSNLDIHQVETRCPGAVLLGNYFLGYLLGWGAAGKYFGALFCVIGHMFPVFYGFKGGKGILCSGTLLLLLDWRIALVGWGAFVVLWLTTRYVSLGSVAAAVSLPFTTYFVFHNTACTVLGTCISLLVLWAHRSNIKRLLSGTESKFHFHVNAPKPGEDE